MTRLRLVPFALLPPGLVAAAGLMAAGCASGCGATADKLSELRRGMTYQEASGVMGCRGDQVSRASSESGEFATVEWDGPELRLARRTQLDFLDGRLLSFTIRRTWDGAQP